MVNKKKVEKHIRGLLEAIGENPEREGLKDTPKRVAKMYEEVYAGIQYSNDDIVEMFNKTFEDDLSLTEDMVIIKDIDAFSYCEHHLALMYDMKVTVAYIPNKKVIGLSKVARIVDMVTKRLQLQERISTDIAYIMEQITGSKDVAVLITGNHSCMTARGIKKVNSKTYTQTLHGKFKEPEYFNRLK